MRPVLTVSEMHAVDAEAARTTPLDVLVGRAGQAVAGAALRLMGGAYGRGWSWWPDRATTGPTAGWPRRSWAVEGPGSW